MSFEKRVEQISATGGQLRPVKRQLQVDVSRCVIVPPPGGCVVADVRLEPPMTSGLPFAGRPAVFRESMNSGFGVFTKQARGLSATTEPAQPEPVPKWLSQALVHVVHLPRDQVERMSLAEAEQVWADYTSGPGSAT